MSVNDSRICSILKAFSWRFIATLTTVVISLLITGSIKAALSIGVFEFFAKIVLYYLHERLWIKLQAVVFRKTEKPIAEVSS